MNPALELRALKIAVGLALESAILSGADTSTLASLYSDPDPQSVWELHGRLMESVNHRDREAGIWLETGLK